MPVGWPADGDLKGLWLALLRTNHFVVGGSMMQHRTTHLQMTETTTHPLHPGESQHLPLIITKHRPTAAELDLRRVEARTEGANPQQGNVNVFKAGKKNFHANSLLELAW